MTTTSSSKKMVQYWTIISTNPDGTQPVKMQYRFSTKKAAEWECGCLSSRVSRYLYKVVKIQFPVAK